MANPIQIVLNPDNFDEAREAGGGGGRKDFYAHRDREFIAHKAALMDQLDSISKTLNAQSHGPIGYLKVMLRREAWAKSHRPVSKLFRSDRTPVVGGGDLGEMLVEGHPTTLAQVRTEIQRSETVTLMRFNEARGCELPHPSPQRSEAGAIDRIELYGPSDKRRFSVEQAVTRLSNPTTGSGYEVELFDVVTPREEWDRLDTPHRELISTFVKGFGEVGNGMSVERLPHWKRGMPRLSVRLDKSTNGAVMGLTNASSTVRNRRALAPFDGDPQRHSALLNFLDKHPLVRSIELPGPAFSMPCRSDRISEGPAG